MLQDHTLSFNTVIPDGSYKISSKLNGLKFAVYLLKCINFGLNEKEIIDLITNDHSLKEWISYLIDNEWIKRSGNKFEITEKGKMWLQRYENGW